MKAISARATYSKKAKDLFSVAGRETVQGILTQRTSDSEQKGRGHFVVKGTVVRTYASEKLATNAKASALAKARKK